MRSLGRWSSGSNCSFNRLSEDWINLHRWCVLVSEVFGSGWGLESASALHLQANSVLNKSSLYLFYMIR